jgi:hypothetical protein
MSASVHRVRIPAGAGQAALQTIGNQKELETCQNRRQETYQNRGQEFISFAGKKP